VGVLLREAEAVGLLLTGDPVIEGVAVGVTVGVTVVVTEAELLRLMELETEGEAPILKEEVGVAVTTWTGTSRGLTLQRPDFNKEQSP
jgi:hypothetical protein